MQTTQAEKPQPGEFQNSRPEVPRDVRDMALTVENLARRVGRLADLRATPAAYADAVIALRKLTHVVTEMKRGLRS